MNHDEDEKEKGGYMIKDLRKFARVVVSRRTEVGRRGSKISSSQDKGHLSRRRKISRHAACEIASRCCDVVGFKC